MPSNQLIPDEGDLLNMAGSLFSNSNFRVIPHLLEQLRDEAITDIEEGRPDGVPMLRCLAKLRGAINSTAAACGKDNSVV